jgi:hypothetical protein
VTVPEAGSALDGLTLVALGSDDAGLCVDGSCALPPDADRG